jgi:hypothetical protein
VVVVALNRCLRAIARALVQLLAALALIVVGPASVAAAAATPVSTPASAAPASDSSPVTTADLGDGSAGEAAIAPVDGSVRGTTAARAGGPGEATAAGRDGATDAADAAGPPTNPSAVRDGGSARAGGSRHATPVASANGSTVEGGTGVSATWAPTIGVHDGQRLSAARRAADVNTPQAAYAGPAGQRAPPRG